MTHLLILLAAISPESAAPQQAAPGKPVSTQAEPLICQKQEVVGSRLAARRVCKTRADWADMQLQDRQGVERVQNKVGKRP